jgi:hypothetical protein
MPQSSLECNKMVEDHTGKRTRAKGRSGGAVFSSRFQADFSIPPTHPGPLRQARFGWIGVFNSEGEAIQVC